MSTTDEAGGTITPDAGHPAAHVTAGAAAHVTVQTTVDSLEAAEKLASAAVEARLAACVQVSEVRSFYRWKGEVHQDPELLLSLKTSSSAVGALQDLLQEQHPYEEPEIIVLPIIGGSRTYLDWVEENSRG